MERANGRIKTAIIEDDEAERERLCRMLDMYAENNNVEFVKSVFNSGESFLSDFQAEYDIVFMDIQLPDIDGMEASRRMREIDKNVLLVFVTNFAKYAINGYEVGATDFIVKPVEYGWFETKMDNLISRIPEISNIVILVKTSDGTALINTSRLEYVEIMGHKLAFHTVDGNHNSYGTLKAYEDKLYEAGFLRCNSCYLVNPRYVTALKSESVVVGGDELKISLPKRKEFKRQMTQYLGNL